MKTRIGFVSNSSSTSFSIFGVEKYLDYQEDEDDDDYDDYGKSKEVQDIQRKAVKAGLEFYYDYEQPCYAVGLSWCNIGGEETGNQFMAKVNKKIAEVMGETTECRTIESEYTT